MAERAISGPVARWQRPLADGRILCEACPRACKLGEGQRGLCFVRGRAGDVIRLDTWGRSSGFALDPVEKKPLSHFLPGTSTLSFGTAGCNLACDFCQNHEISKSRKTDTLAVEAMPEAIVAAALKAGASSISFTYNDPVIFAEYALDVAAEARKAGLATIAVTAGHVAGAARDAFFAGMDAVNIDLKAFSDDFYRRHAKGDLETVADTIRHVARLPSVWMEITTLLIPGLNDSDAEITALSQFVAREAGLGVPLHFSRFHPDHRMKDRPPTPLETLNRARRIAKRVGLHHVYTGNVDDCSRQTTWCPDCGEALIRRERFRLLDYRLQADGGCPACKRRLEGVYESAAGRFNGRRRRIEIEALPVSPVESRAAV